LAAELVDRKVDMIVAAGGYNSALAAKSATSTIPIVFTGVSDPVATGLVASLARRGGNLTGFSPLIREMMPKRLVEPGTNRKRTPANAHRRCRQRLGKGPVDRA
jgi:putative tryptophan/tyrosine transport system substrate-binding protein